MTDSSDKGLLSIIRGSGRLNSRVLQIKNDDSGKTEPDKAMLSWALFPEHDGIVKILKGLYPVKRIKGLYGFSEAFNILMPNKREYFAKKKKHGKINPVKFQAVAALTDTQKNSIHKTALEDTCPVVYFDDSGGIYSVRGLVEKAFNTLKLQGYASNDADIEIGYKFVLNLLTKAVITASGAPPKVHVITSKAELDALAEKIAANNPRPLVLDIETDGLDAHTSNIVGIGLCMDASEGYYIPLTKPEKVFSQTFYVNAPQAVNSICRPSDVADFVRHSLASAKIVAHNAKFELQFFKASYGVDLNVLLDTMVGEYILDCRLKGRFNLGKSVAERFPLVEEWKESDAFFKNLRNIEIGIVANYCVRDCCNEFLLLAAQYQPLLKNYKYLATQVDMPFIQVLAEAEAHGFCIDKSYLIALKGTLGEKVAELDKVLETALPGINVDSNKQLATALYDNLKLPIIKRTDSGAPSTDAATLEELHKQTQNETLSVILDRRGYNKLAATYTTSFIEKMNPVTNNVHPSFSNIATETGRLACHSPNF